MDLRLALKFVVGSVAGLILEALVAKRLAGSALQRTFAALVAAVGAGTLIQVLV